MRPAILAILVLALLPAALAATPSYYTVVDDDAPASDVVSAANFAASMKGSVAVTFSGKLASDMEGMTGAQLQDSVIVVFDGRDARILRGGNPAFDAQFDDVVEASQIYLDRQGFDVTVGTASPAEFGSSDDADSDGGAAGEAEPEAPETTAPARNTTNTTQQDADDLVVEVQAPQEQELPPPAPEAPEEPGVFSRMWRWFAGIFD